MIDLFAIFERGGTILWSRPFAPIKGDPLALLVRSVLLEDRLSIPEASFDSYTLRWKLDNQHGLVFVVMYQRALPPAYSQDLLTLVRSHFLQHELPPSDTPLDASWDFSKFDPHFDRLLDKAEKLAARSKDVSTAAPRRKPKRASAPSRDVEPQTEKAVEPELDIASEETTLSAEDMRRNREAFLSRRGGQKKSGTTRKTDGGEKSAPVMNGSVTTKKKIMRPGKQSKEDLSALDFSEGQPPEGSILDNEASKAREKYLYAPRNTGLDDILNSSDEGEDADEEDTDNEDEESDDTNVKHTGRKVGGSLFNYFKGLAGLRALTREDLKAAMEQFRDGLVGKNVAKDIADKLIESVTQSLEGKTMESMTSVTTMVRKALDEALTRILTPQQSTDILGDIAANKGRSRPYVITYCGVNGVGKSTSLAKTCYYLMNHGYKVLIAACDTFRAGAVEQLRTHVRCLGKGVELFDRGYGKDAAGVAADAIQRARELKYDVVLVDTAGRMQDNEPLMRALSKLVEVNRPDRLFFVGEALVGNDAVDQVSKFNKALTDHQSGGNPRLIDGIVLTKMDTIDDKVGAAVSMVYTTGQPIVFIGIGQTYMDLRKMNTRALVKALLK